MSRRDRLRQGAEAKERVLSGVYNVPRQSVSAPSRRDRLKAPEEIANIRAGIDSEVRSMAPELFNPQQNLNVFNKMVQPQESRPMYGPPVPKELGAAQRQSAAQSSPLTRFGEFAANLADDIIPGSFGNKPVKRPIESLSSIPDIPGITTANPVTNFIRGAGDTATLGLSSYLDRIGGNVEAAEGSTQTGAGRAGQIAGGFVLPAGKLKAGASLISNIGRGARAGALLGAGIEAGEMATGRNNQTLSQRAGDVGLSAALGGAGAGVFGGIGVLVNRMKKNNVPDEVVQELLALPAPRQRGNVNAAQTPDVMPGFGGGRLPELPAPGPLGLPEPRFPQPSAQQAALPLPRNMDRIQRAQGTVLPQGEGTIFSPASSTPTSARIGQKPNPYRQQFEALMQRAKEIQDQGGFTPGREMEELESLWSQMAGRDAVGIDELIQRAYVAQPNRVTTDLVQRARSTQGAREVAGAPLPVRTQADRFPGLQRTEGPVPSTPRSDVEYTPDQLAASRQVQQEFVQNLTRKQRLNTPIVGRAEAPVERVGRAQQVEVKPRTEVLPAQTQPLRPRTEVNPSLNAGPKRVDPIQEAEEIVAAVNKPRTRDRVYSYLDEAEKAARERISKRRNRLSANPIDEWADHAIVMAAKVGKGTIKAADFTEELVKEFGEQVRPHADRIFRQTKEVLRTQERRATKEGQAADSFNNSGQGNASTFDQKINRTIGKKKEPFSKRWEKMRTQLIDDLAPLEGLEKRVKGAVSSAEDSLYKTARMFKGTPEKASQIVQTRLSPIIKSVEDAGKSADDLGRYALAVHAKDVNAAGYKSGFTNAEIDDVIRQFGTPEMEAARKQLIQVNKDMMKELVSGGVVSKELANVLNERWQNYIPLFRSFDDEAVEFGGGLSSALANVASPIKGLKGSERAVIDPLENMVKNIFQSVNAAERNKVAGQLAKLAESDAEGNFIRKLDPDEKVDRKNVVNVKVNGDNIKYEVEPEVYKAMLNLDKESSNMITNILAKPASLLRAGATLTPEFSLRNPMRDVLQAFVTSKSGFNPITDFTAGLVQSISKGKLYQEWVNNLGAYGNVISMDRNVHRQALEKVLKEPASKKFVNIVTGKSLINVLRAIADTTESATKVGEFRAALRKGVSPQEAAYRSRDLMDFARAGTGIRQANKMVAFLNANIQGKSKLIRAIKENPIGTTTRAFAAVTVPTIGIYMLNDRFANEKQKETISESPDWLKDSFWLVAIPGTDVVARIPKPFDLAPLFANLPERALQFTQKNDPEAFDGFVKRTASSMALPSQISGLLPFIEGMANYSFFREGPIIPQREAGLQFKDQYDPVRTTEAAKLLAAGADKLTGGKGAFKNFSSPRIVDNTVKGLTAGLGSYATSAIDSLLQGKVFGQKIYKPLIDRPEAPQKRVEQLPLAKAFLVDPLQSTRSTDKLYTRKEELTREKGSAKLNDTDFTNSKELKTLEKASDRLSKINKEIRSIEASGMTAAEKRRMIEPLLAERNQISKITMEKVKR